MFVDQKGFVYAVDAANGRLLWSRKVDDHPLVRLTGSPALYDGRLYVPTSSYEEGGKPPGYACCTFRGSIVALDAQTGDDRVEDATRLPTSRRLLRAYADGTELRGTVGRRDLVGADDRRRSAARSTSASATPTAVPAQPTTDAMLAFDLKTGAMRWSRQMAPSTPDVFGCTPGDVNCGERPGPTSISARRRCSRTLASGRELIVAGQKSGVVYALDPDRKGEQVWRYRAGGGSGLGGIQWGIAADATRVYVPVAEIYNPAPGGLHAVDLATGARAWYAPPRAAGVRQAEPRLQRRAVFGGHGHSRRRVFAVERRGGAGLFDEGRPDRLDVRHEPGVPDHQRRYARKGGSMNGPAPVVAGGMVYVSSGYGAFGLRPGMCCWRSGWTDCRTSVPATSTLS